MFNRKLKKRIEALEQANTSLQREVWLLKDNTQIYVPDKDNLNRGIFISVAKAIQEIKNHLNIHFKYNLPTSGGICVEKIESKVLDHLDNNTKKNGNSRKA